MANKSRKARMEWHLTTVMARRKVRTATDLHRQLLDIGIEISSAQLSRLMNENPRRLSSEVMYGLTKVLQCDVSDLWTNPDRSRPPQWASAATPTESPASNEPAETPGPSQEVRRKRKRPATAQSVSGPKFEAYPVKEN